ncbi:Glutamate-aspartate carrier protein (fragment) [Capnocytophaga canimorsus]|uniref:Glutamate-aspartate carrier protein n=1 Tax=Capnocytophaga canimorsus TaxID=28188 RepID=A0A0B7HF41_9FLAO
MKKIALYWQIIIGMILGVLLALLMLQFSWGKDWVLDYIKPFGVMFLNALKLIAVPLILASLIKGISDLKDIAKFSKIGIRAISIYMITTIMAVTLGLLVANTVKPGEALTAETRQELVQNYKQQADSNISKAQQQKEARPLDALQNIIPDNIVKSASNNINMLQIIFCAIFFGIAMIFSSRRKGTSSQSLFLIV